MSSISAVAGPSKPSPLDSFKGPNQTEEFEDDDELMVDFDQPESSSSTSHIMPPSSTQLDPSLPAFTALSASQQALDMKDEFRRVPIPPHRMTPLKKEWINIYTPLVEMAGLQVRMNVKRKCIEIKVRETRRHACFYLTPG